MQDQPLEEWIVEHTVRAYRLPRPGPARPALAADCWGHDCPSCRQLVLLWRDWAGRLRTQFHDGGCKYACEADQLARAWGFT
jgi:hypothetical protein